MKVVVQQRQMPVPPKTYEITGLTEEQYDFLQWLTGMTDTIPSALSGTYYGIGKSPAAMREFYYALKSAPRQ